MHARGFVEQYSNSSEKAFQKVKPENGELHRHTVALKSLSVNKDFNLPVSS
jgi:hypothetical protein